jgi:hypothetical protein
MKYKYTDFSVESLDDFLNFLFELSVCFLGKSGLEE